MDNAQSISNKVNGFEAVKISEGEVENVAYNKAALYPSITSCLTITCGLENASKIGSHCLITGHTGDQIENKEMIPTIKKAISIANSKLDCLWILGDREGEWLVKCFEPDTALKYEYLLDFFIATRLGMDSLEKCYSEHLQNCHIAVLPSGKIASKTLPSDHFVDDYTEKNPVPINDKYDSFAYVKEHINVVEK